MMHKTLYMPDRIIIEQSALSLPYTQKILGKFANIPIETVGRIHDIKKYSSNESPENVVLITNYKGSLIKKCPGSSGVLCCNYYVANLINGCPFACEYCILQDYLNCGCVMVCSNIATFFEELRQVVKPGYILRLGTGELADSLAFDYLFDLTDELIPRMHEFPDVILELKTKSDCVKNILKYDAPGNIVIAWSLNPQELIDRYEHNATPLRNRLNAAISVVSKGYKTAFHFDPIILVPGWEKLYKQVIDELFASVAPEHISWISLGGLRFMPSLKRVSMDRFPQTDMFSYGEFVMCKDGKFRYFYPMRRDMYRTVAGYIHEYYPSAPVYFCMESPKMWNDVFGALPTRISDISHVYDPYPYDAICGTKFQDGN
ncbi:MAG: hypothetical protein C4541_01565 [Candidatus Auribacter fodinae]|uniref:DNA photolyase n=1 Tax=Candidatus Auribacter fodinae TaxID=2093366 RepID=A0A3A4RGJ4_9BACT|nr:MAG: hypothetical protein C4541_01565 [Candidatus Auribacter fodinae]